MDLLGFIVHIILILDFGISSYLLYVVRRNIGIIKVLQKDRTEIKAALIRIDRRLTVLENAQSTL